MPVEFNKIQLGQAYTRPQLASLWNYVGYEAISRGVITPRNTPFIILFITREKQKFLTQYEDTLENGILKIEGETNHAADDRIINASTTGDEIHLFYRDRHHMAFTYYGQIYLLEYKLHAKPPSLFTFRVPSEHLDDSLETELITHGQPNKEFVPDPEGRKIIRQHVSYERSPRNRRRALEIHGNRCKACGFSFDEVYGSAHALGFIEIHHTVSITAIKRPVNPEVDLIPLCSNCHSMAHKVRDKILTLHDLQKLLKLNNRDQKE
jgi:5-methylcytosine-specific restriction enzyme A